MKTIEEKIKIMTAYKNGAEIEANEGYGWESFNNGVYPSWNWRDLDYRIKEQKKTVTIEEWLIEHINEEHRIVETSNIELYVRTGCKKVKMLSSYEVEI